MSSAELISRLKSHKRMSILLLAIILVSSTLACYYAVTFMARPSLIGILEVDGPILTEDQVALYSQAIMEAMLNDSIRGVVLKVDSPGGYADLVEQIYLDLLELRGRKPLVASVTMALSGGYYISVASSYIYAHPTSMVGNVGVIGVGPPVLVPSEMVLESGVHKVTGYSRLMFAFNLSRALDSFVNAVESGRGDRLKLPSKELRRGSIYMGSEAVEVGLVDEIGSVQSAMKRVAQAAGVVEYSVVDLVESVRGKVLTLKPGAGEQVSWTNLTVARLNEINPPPSIYYLYLPTGASLYAPEVEGKAHNEGLEGGEGKGLVLVDKSHGNLVSYWDLEVLVRELMLRNVTASFVNSWSSLESKLDSAAGVIVAAPTTPYSEEQVERLKSFVRSGKVLVIIYDPAAEYVKIPDLSWPANSLSLSFGISFDSGYLYDEERSFGFYRNIYVEGFKNHTLTSNLSRVVLFTSTSIYSANGGIAWTRNTTSSSVAERPDRYDVISVVGLNGSVVALGDLTFLQEPYCYVEDNYKLIRNLASLIAASETGVKPETNVSERVLNRPSLPVGTTKEFLEKVDDEAQELRWYKVSDFEIRVERPGVTTRYLLDENGSLVKVLEDGMEVVYETPIPEPPYPLREGASWRHESNYTLRLIDEGKAFKGRVVSEERVVGFSKVEALDGRSYTCAEIEYTYTDSLEREGFSVTIISRGVDWISSEAGLVKEEETTKYYVDSILTSTEIRSIILKSIKR
jgi:protease-4